MVELVRTNDVVLLSWLQTALGDAGIDCLVLDQHASVIEGSIGALPRRVMVLEEDYSHAKRILDHGEAHGDA